MNALEEREEQYSHICTLQIWHKRPQTIQLKALQIERDFSGRLFSGHAAAAHI